MHPFKVSAGFCLRNTSEDNVQDNILRDGVKTSTFIWVGEKQTEYLACITMTRAE